jgi:ABC-type uncharacterized transport system involved in gliding motility auxiliary subunit
MAMRKGTRAATESLGFLLITAGILVFLNILGTFVWGRIDCTERELFSLSEGSKRVAGRFTDTVTITAYFTEDLPYPFNATEVQVRDLLTEYEAAGRGNVDVRFVTVDTDEEREEAEEAGIQRVQHQAIEDDNMAVKEGYRGLVMMYLDQKEVIPVIEDTSGLEYRITMKLKEMVGDQKKIGVVSGHDGPTLQEGLSRVTQCAPTYEMVMVPATEEIDPDEYDAILVVEPHTELSQAELERLNQYVMNGGSLGVFGGSMKIETEGMPQSVPVDTGLNRLLRPWGVVVEPGLVADAYSGRAPLRTNIGVLPVPHPPVPIVRFDEAQSEHPVLFRLPEAPFPFVSPLALVGDAAEGVEKTTLARSSDQSWLLTGESIGLQPRMPREWQQTGEAGPFPLMVALRGKLPSAFGGASNMSPVEDQPAPTVEAPAQADDARVLVAGTGFFMRDEIMGQPQPGRECELSGPLALALNAVDWLAQDADLIAIRAKNVEEPTIEVPQNVREAEQEARDAAETALSAAQQGDEAAANEAVEERNEALERRKAAMAAWDAKKALYRWGNILGIPLVFAVFGLIRWQIRTNKRKNLKL